MADRGQRKIDEEALRPAFFEKCAKDHEQDDVGREDVCHNAEDAVTLVKNTGAQIREGIAGVRNQFGQVVTEDAIQDHDRAHDDKDDADHPARHLDADEHAHHRHPFIELGLGAGTIVDHFKINDPVTQGHDRTQDQHIIERAPDSAGWSDTPRTPGHR